MKRKGFLALAGIGGAIATVAASQMPFGQPEFIVVSHKLDQVMQPKSGAATLLECMNDRVCGSALQALATQIGLPSSGLTVVRMVGSLTGTAGAEEKYWNFPLPSGFRYCRSQINIVSVVPNDGPRASVMNARSTEDGVAASTWTPRRGFGEGRSWVEADITIVGVHASAADRYRASGKCRSPRELFNCRGNGGGDRPACKGVNID